jgi:hypothetical protein
MQTDFAQFGFADAIAQRAAHVDFNFIGAIQCNALRARRALQIVRRV